VFYFLLIATSKKSKKIGTPNLSRRGPFESLRELELLLVFIQTELNFNKFLMKP